MVMKRYWITKGIMFGIFIAAGMLLMGLAVMLLWNAILPIVTGVGELSFIQALGLLVLCRLLFRGFGGWGGHRWGGGGWGGGNWHDGEQHGGGPGYWKQRWKEKMANMSPEERARMKAFYKERCGKSWSGNQEAEEVTESDASQPGSTAVRDTEERATVGMGS